jgi:hypothetical protein
VHLLESVRQWVLKNLPHSGAPDVVATLDAMGPRSLLVLYLNWRERFIAVEPRQVFRSSTFDNNPIVLNRASMISPFIEDIECGRDLTKYLSRRVTIGFDLPPKPSSKDLSKLQHLDLLLNDWGIYHLHISTDVNVDGFARRDGLLLFAIFKPGRAYLIDVKSHEDFANDHLLRIVLDAWPDDGLLTEVKGVCGPRQSTSDLHRKRLRSAGISGFLQLGGRMYSPGTAIPTAGTSVRASVYSGRILKMLRQFKESVERDPSKLIAFIRECGGNPPDILEFEFSFFQNGYGVVEKSSGVPILLSA